MRINQNIAAFNSYRNLSQTNNVMGKSLEKLSSGFRINRAADDAAGLVISQGLRAQVSGLRQATRNAQDGISVVQTAEGALNEVHSMLNRMRDLAVQASNGSNDDDARAAAQAEINELAGEIDRISETTRFGQIALLSGGTGGTDGTDAVPAANVTTGEITLGDWDGDAVEFSVNGTAITLDGDYTGNGAALATAINAQLSAADSDVSAAWDSDNETIVFSTTGTDAIAITDANAAAGDAGFANVTGDAGTPADPGTPGSGNDFTFQVGANSGDVINFSIATIDAASLGVSGINVTTFEGAQEAIDAIDGAIADVSSTRGTLGAVQNRFESTIANLQVTTENLAASESRIRDTDMALEMVDFTRHQILLQAGTAMLGQANQLPQSVLRLLG